MKVTTPEQFKAASDRWLDLESTLNQNDQMSPGTRRFWEARQIEIERAMAESPFEFDEDDNVVLKASDAPIVNDRIRML